MKKVRQTYQQELEKHLSEDPYVASESVEDNWRTLKECIIYASKDVDVEGEYNQIGS